MNLAEYRAEFLEDLNAQASAASNFTHSMFVEVCAELLGDAEELSDFEPCYYRGSGSRNRSLAIDGFAQDSVDGSLRLVVADFSGDAEMQTLESDSGEDNVRKAHRFLR